MVLDPILPPILFFVVLLFPEEYFEFVVQKTQLLRVFQPLNNERSLKLEIFWLKSIKGQYGV